MPHELSVRFVEGVQVRARRADEHEPARGHEGELEAFSLPELVQDVVQEFQLRAQEKGVELSADLSERLPFVNADIRLIERVLKNLIENALRYTPRGGAIEIALRQEEGRVKVEIHDNGVGIPAEEISGYPGENILGDGPRVISGHGES